MKLCAACWLLASLAVASAQVRLPSYSRETLPNGIVLDVMPRRELPLVTLRIVIKGGVESEPAGLAGLAGVTAEAIRRGAGQRTAEQFALELDSLGATLNTSADMQSSTVTAEFLAKDLDKGLSLIMDALRRPSFSEAEMKKLLAQRIDDAKSLKDNPGAAASEYYRGFYFGASHPYGRTIDELSLAAIKTQDIAAYHKSIYVGRNMIFAVVGDVDGPAVTARLQAVLKEVPSGTPYTWKADPPPVKPAGNHRLAFVDKPDATQTNFLIGQPGISRRSPDRVPLWLVNTLFGGRFTSILNDELRVNSGLTYGARSRVDENRLPGRLTISSFTRTEPTGKAIDMALELLKRLRDKGITAEQLSSAKAYVKGTYPAQEIETADQLASALTEIELFDLNRGEIDDLFSRIDAVTLDHANEIVKRYFSPESLTFMLVGNTKAFASEMTKYGKPVQVNIGTPGFQIPAVSRAGASQ